MFCVAFQDESDDFNFFCFFFFNFKKMTQGQLQIFGLILIGAGNELQRSIKPSKMMND